MESKQGRPNHWKGFMLGTVGSVAGLIAMDLYWQYVAPLLADEEANDSQNHQPEPLDDISLVGKQYKKDESSTAALGRLIYEQMSGQEPPVKTKTMMSNLVHWAYGMLQGGLYGALRSSAPGLDLKGGLLYGSSLWLLGDELAVPLLGLQSGSTAMPAQQHLNRLGAHLAYGLGTAAATHMLRRMV